MGKGKEKLDTDGPSRERSISWDDGQTKFMLDWFIEFWKDQHAGFQIKKQHHLKCADTLNKKFHMGVTVEQVNRHFRHYKENWKYVSMALSKTGNGFDPTRCIITISDSQKATLIDRARRLLSKPIKFFHEMQELFTGTNADGSLAMDPLTCMEPKEDITSDDSDNLPSPLSGAPSKSPGVDNSSSSSGVKRKRMVKSPIKRTTKSKSRMARTNDEISATLKVLQEFLAVTALPPPPTLADPHVALWERVEAITITTDQKLMIGMFLSSNENKGLRCFLTSASDTTLQAWVYKFLSSNRGGTM